MIRIYHNFQEYGNETLDGYMHEIFAQIKAVFQGTLKSFDERINAEGGCIVIEFNKEEFRPYVKPKGCSEGLTKELEEQIAITFAAWLKIFYDKYSSREK